MLKRPVTDEFHIGPVIQLDGPEPGSEPTPELIDVGAERQRCRVGGVALAHNPVASFLQGIGKRVGCEFLDSLAFWQKDVAERLSEPAALTRYCPLGDGRIVDLVVLAELGWTWL